MSFKGALKPIQIITPFFLVMSVATLVSAQSSDPEEIISKIYEKMLRDEDGYCGVSQSACIAVAKQRADKWLNGKGPELIRLNAACEQNVARRSNEARSELDRMQRTLSTEEERIGISDEATKATSYSRCQKAFEIKPRPARIPGVQRPCLVMRDGQPSEPDIPELAEIDILRCRLEVLPSIEASIGEARRKQQIAEEKAEQVRQEYQSRQTELQNRLKDAAETATKSEQDSWFSTPPQIRIEYRSWIGKAEVGYPNDRQLYEAYDIVSTDDRTFLVEQVIVNDRQGNNFCNQSPDKMYLELGQKITLNHHVIMFCGSIEKIELKTSLGTRHLRRNGDKTSFSIE